MQTSYHSSPTAIHQLAPTEDNFTECNPKKIRINKKIDVGWTIYGDMRLIVVHFGGFPYRKDNNTVWPQHHRLILWSYDMVGDDRATNNKTNTKPINIYLSPNFHISRKDLVTRGSVRRFTFRPTTIYVWLFNFEIMKFIFTQEIYFFNRGLPIGQLW